MEIDSKRKDVDLTMYRGIIGSLLYLTTNGLDISYAVRACARFQSKPKGSHMHASKKILHYLKRTQNVGLWYPKSSYFKLIDYLDTNFESCKIDRRNIFGTCQFLRTGLVSWFSIKQNSTPTTTIEAEYITTRSCCA